MIQKSVFAVGGLCYIGKIGQITGGCFMRLLFMAVVGLVLAGCGNVDWFPTDNNGTVASATPNAFVFTPSLLTDVPINTLQISNTVTITGTNATGWTVSVSGDSSSKFSINNGAFTNTPSIILPNQTLSVQHTSSANLNATVTTTVTVGTTYSTSFQSTTVTQ
jgi:hypothetical protein